MILYKEGDFPEFLRIEHILLSDGNIIFAGSIYNTEYFNNHFHCAVLQDSKQNTSIRQLNEYYPYSLHLRNLYLNGNNRKVVVLKHYISS
jgi:hypothetical protein